MLYSFIVIQAFFHFFQQIYLVLNQAQNCQVSQCMVLLERAQLTALLKGAAGYWALNLDIYDPES